MDKDIVHIQKMSHFDITILQIELKTKVLKMCTKISILCVDHKNCGKFWKRWEYQTTLSASWETCMQVRKQQLELDMEQQTGSKLGKE